jgi:hypothetical protein
MAEADAPNFRRVESCFTCQTGVFENPNRDDREVYCYLHDFLVEKGRSFVCDNHEAQD